MPDNLTPNRRRPTLIELATMYNEPKGRDTNVFIETNRFLYGYNATISNFSAIAYDNNGVPIDSLKGYFLEPASKYELASTEGSDTAILPGTYSIIPKWDKRQKYHWYLTYPKGRSGIAIHPGRSGANTSGCLIPGNGYEIHQHEKGDSLTISNAKAKTEELFHFFNKYGNGNIKIKINDN